MGAKPKVLIVEDDKIVKNSLERLLRGNDCEVESAASGEEGLEKYSQAPCDLVVADLKLPGIDGLEMVSRMREQDDIPPFVVMSAYGELEDAIRALRLGAVDFFQKPFDAYHILNLTRSIIHEGSGAESKRKNSKKSSGHKSEGTMKTAEKPSPRQLAETLSPEAVQLYRLLAPFISIGRHGTGITHNLNSPLTGLMGHLELMKLKNPELSNDLDIIMGLAKKLREPICNPSTRWKPTGKFAPSMSTKFCERLWRISRPTCSSSTIFAARWIFKVTCPALPELMRILPSLSRRS
jgi:DNA-binding response OmpR family regulator